LRPARSWGEEKHRDQLTRLHGETTGSSGDPKLEGAEGIMEGGVDREEALAWARQREAVDVPEFAAAMEANAHDRYILVGRAVGGATERVFFELAEAEKVHLNQLLEAFTARLS
jgi:rubrerythrin